MQYVLATDYAIRTVLYLTMIDRMATAGEIAEKIKVPRQYLSALAGELAEAGVLALAQGISGGYYLARIPERITLLEIVRIMEGTARRNRCLEQNRFCMCESTGSCQYSASCSDVQSLMDYYLAGVTLRDMAAEARIAGEYRKSRQHLVRMCV